MEWFSVDKAGLAKILARKGKAFAILELVQNAWDTGARRVDVRIETIPGRPLAKVTVEDDDPNGFVTLAHAFTLFAESEKKGDPTKRGRFNLGEKLVLALCEEAEIVSTKGSVRFDAEGRHAGRKKRDRGSVFEGMMRLTRDEVVDVNLAIDRLLVPRHCATYFNGSEIRPREMVDSYSATLSTEIADEEGYLKRAIRETTVTCYEPREGETPTLYEMGIPVVELTGGEKWHVDIGQKIPLNMDRDNVTPAYLQTLRVLLANAMIAHVAKDDADAVWLTAATEDERVESDVVEKVLDERFGKKRAVFDLSDPEANKQLMNEGYAIIHGGSLSKGQWANVKAASLALPAGQIRPSGVGYDPDGSPERVVDPKSYTIGMQKIVLLAKAMAHVLLNVDLQVKVVNEATALPYLAWYGKGVLAFNVGRLGKGWFDRPPQHDHVELILHELAHHEVSDHLTREFADEVARLSVLLVEDSLRADSLLRKFDYEAVRR